jgi:hypothetical protein
MTLNAYSYVHGDPLNRVDSGGLCDVIIAGVTESPGQPETVGMNEFATATGAIQDYPYSGGSIPSGVADVLAPGLTGKAAPATVSAVIAILLAAQDPGPINIFTFSGGAEAFRDAVQYLPSDVVARINNVTYIAPGAIGGLPAGNGRTTLVLGNFWSLDTAVGLGLQIPLGTTVVEADCRHDSNCEFAQTVLRSLSGSACSDPVTIWPHPPTANPSRGVSYAPGLDPFGIGISLILSSYQQQVVSSTITFGSVEDVSSTITFHDVQ